MRARAERDEDARLPAQQPRPLVLLGEPHRAVHERDVDPAVRQRLDVGALVIERDRPEHHLHALEQGGEPLAEVHHRLLAAAAGGIPVERDARLPAARGGAGASASRPGGRRGGVAGRHRVERAGGVRERPERAERLGHLAHRRREALALGGARPGDPEARRLDARLLERAHEHRVARRGAEVAVEVVAVAGVTARDEHAVGALAEGLEDERRLDAPGAHDPHGEEALRVSRRAWPARSAAEYAHQLQRKATMRGSCAIALARPSARRGAP